MDGYHPNAFLAKKLMTEGLLNDDEEVNKPKESDKTEKSKNENPLQTVLISVDNDGTKEAGKDVCEEKTTVPPILSHVKTSYEKSENRKEQAKEDGKKRVLEKRKSDSAIEKPVEKRKSDISLEKPVTEKGKEDLPIDKPVVEKTKHANSVDKPNLEKRKSDISLESPSSQNDQKNSPPVKKRKASPIIFDVHKKEKEVDKDKVRERTLSASSDSHVVLTTVSNTHKYDTLPPCK